MKILVKIIILLFMVLLTTSIATAGSKSKKSSSQKHPVKKDNYLKTEFDSKINVLPNKFLGHDIRIIYNALSNRKNVSSKSEFETTEQYNKRVEVEYSKPIMGKMGLNDLYVMSVPAKMEYDADKSIAYVDIRTSMVRNGYKLEDNTIEITGPNISSSASNYIGSNAFGATTEVTSSHSKDSYLAVVNPSVLGMANKDDYFKGIRFTINNVDIEKAKLLKENARVLLLFNLSSPYTSSGFGGTSATFDSPYSSYRESLNVYGKVTAAWIYNFNDGEVLLKEDYK